ncbi:MAG: efflux RND transporter periplasmic adaptor subunit [Candidatus Deferrimicrobiaceae bacterium]
MKRIVIFVLVAVILVVGGVALVMRKQGEIARLAKPQAPPPAVEVAPVAEGDLEVTVHYLGNIVPFTRSDISSRISGNILTIARREGDVVRQGEALVTIDDRELADRIVAVNAEVLSTRQKLAGAQSVYETQKSIYERDVTLQKAGAISQEALDRSRAALDSAKAAADAYEESLKGLAMNTAVARTQAGYARLTAPFDGVISRRWNEPGDLAVPGKPILTIEKRSPYKVLAQVPQEELALIRPGTPVHLRNGDQHIEAAVNRVYPALGKNMLATVEVITKSSPFNLPSDATVGMDLVIRRVKGIIVPEQAVVTGPRGASVCLVRDGVVHLLPVRLLGMGSGKAAVSGEVHVGDQVAVAQENKLLTLGEGSRVTPAEAGKHGIPAGGKP